MDSSESSQHNSSDSDNKDQIAEFLDKVLVSDASNNLALYGKSLICYRQGKIEDSAQNLNKAMEAETFPMKIKSEELKANLIELLEPKPPTEVYILDELKKKHEDLKHHEVS